MDAQKILTQLQRKYPGKNIFQNSPKNPSEIICEIDPTSDHPDYSIAIAVIDKSLPHYHRKTTETYEILVGELMLIVRGKMYKLKKGDVFTFKPGNTHHAIGKETWVKVTSHPGWISNDHLL